MTAADAPHVLLTQAADKIETMTAAASPGPWTSSGIGDFGWGVMGPSGAAEFEDSEVGLADAEWVAAMSPAVGPHLVAWLRDAQWMYEADEVRKRALELGEARHYVGPVHEAALAFARCVLGMETR